MEPHHQQLMLETYSGPTGLMKRALLVLVDRALKPELEWMTVVAASVIT